MNDILKVLQMECMEAIGFFSDVYLFGSSLYKTNPNDIDLLVVYEGDASFSIEKQKEKIFDLLVSETGIECHFVTLSRDEMDQTRFLNYVTYKKIK